MAEEVLQTVQMPVYRDCNDITAWMEAFQVALPLDDGICPGTYINPTADQLDYALQRARIWQAIMTQLCQVAMHLPPDYVYEAALCSIRGTQTVVRNGEEAHIAAHQWTPLSKNLVLRTHSVELSPQARNAPCHRRVLEIFNGVLENGGNPLLRNHVELERP